MVSSFPMISIEPTLKDTKVITSWALVFTCFNSCIIIIIIVILFHKVNARLWVGTLYLPHIGNSSSFATILKQEFSMFQKSLNSNIRVRCPIIAKIRGCESNLFFSPFLQATCFIRGVFTKTPHLCLGVLFCFVLLLFA